MNKTQKKKQLRVLALDGGGIKGIAAAVVLAELEDRTGKPIADLFDVFVLSSTGSIIGMFLLMPDPNDPTKPKYTARDVVKMYRENGPLIFSKRLLHDLRGFIKEKKYSPENLYKLARDTFAGIRAKQTLKPFLIPIYDIEREHNKRIWLTNIPDMDFTEYYPEMDLSELIMGATAAQTLFPAKAIYTRVEEVDQKTGEISERMVKIAATDGSIFAGQNGLHAHELTQQLLGDDKELLLTSIGTGYETATYSVERWNGLGKLELAQTLVTQLMAETHGQFEKFLSEKMGDKYYRFNGPVNMVKPAAKNDMDNVDPANLDALEALGKAWVTDNPKFIELCHILMQPEHALKHDIRDGRDNVPELREIAQDIYSYARSKIPGLQKPPIDKKKKKFILCRWFQKPANDTAPRLKNDKRKGRNSALPPPPTKSFE